MSLIPNPKKNVVVDFTVDEIKSSLLKLQAYFKNKYTLISKNEILNQYTFSATEFLSLGVWADVNLSFVSDTRTDIIIEIRRKIGATDQWVDVQYANRHIQTLFNGISALLANVRKAAVHIDAANPVQVFTSDLPWGDIKRHLYTLSLTYPNTYSILEDNLTDEIILRRVPQTGDDVVLNIDAILKISKIENQSGIRFEITNDDNKISTQGELQRNTLILKITINLLQKIINDLKNKITQAETELSNIKKWKLGRSDETKEEQIGLQLKAIEELKQKLKK